MNLNSEPGASDGDDEENMAGDNHRARSHFQSFLQSELEGIYSNHL